MRRPRRPPRIAIESVLIVFSILLALAANAWWNGRQDRARVAQALVYLDAEVRSNQAQLERLLPYHRELGGIFRRAAGGEGARNAAQLQEEGFRGFQPPGLVSAAWEASLAGGVPMLMDFETVSLLGRVYSVQARVTRHSQDGLLAMMGPGAFHPDNFESLILQAQGHLTDMVYAQEELLELYATWLAFRAGAD